MGAVERYPAVAQGVGTKNFCRMSLGFGSSKSQILFGMGKASSNPQESVVEPSPAMCLGYAATQLLEQCQNVGLGVLWKVGRAVPMVFGCLFVFLCGGAVFVGVMGGIKSGGVEVCVYVGALVSGLW